MEVEAQRFSGYFVTFWNSWSKCKLISFLNNQYKTKAIKTFLLHSFFRLYLRSKLCSLYENDCIFDKFECCWNGNDTAIMTGSYNNFFRMFDRSSRKEVTYEASKEIAKPKTILKPRKVRYECFCLYSRNCLDTVNKKQALKSVKTARLKNVKNYPSKINLVKLDIVKPIF